MNTLGFIAAAGAALFAAWCCEALAAENRRLRARCNRLEDENYALVGDLLKACGEIEKKAPRYHREAMPCERN